MENIKTAMLFAAGLGTRLKPFTDKHPKALAIVNDKTLLQRNIEYLISFGIEKVVVNVHHFANQIIDIISENNGWGVSVIISDESDEVLETGGGLKKALPFFESEENIIVMNADMLTNLNLHEMAQYHFLNNNNATLAVTERSTSRYLIFNNENLLCGWMNEKTNELKGIETFNEEVYKKMAFSGIQILNKSFFKNIDQVGKFSMIDVYLSKMNNTNIAGFNHSQDILIDVGKPESLEKAATLFL